MPEVIPVAFYSEHDDPVAWERALRAHLPVILQGGRFVKNTLA